MIRVDDNILVFPERERVVVRTTDEKAAPLAALSDTSVVRTADGLALVEMPWCEQSCSIMANIGLDGVNAAPFMHSDIPLVEGRYAPMKHQLHTAAFATLNRRCYVLNDPRTGKTGSLVLAMDYMQRNRQVRGAFLIVTTLTTMHGVWRASIEATLPHARVVVAHGPGRERLLREPADFYITNYDSCRVSEKAFMKAIDAGRIGGLVIDELTHVGNPSSKRHKAIRGMALHPSLTSVIGATGSPAENVDNVFGMCRVINEQQLPCRTFGGWQSLTTYQWGSQPFQRSPSPQAPQVIHAAMQPAVRFAKGDIMDLPPVVTQDRECDMTPEQASARAQFRAQAIALFDSGETITAANGGVLYGKLMQVAQGVCLDNGGRPVYLDYRHRLACILDAINESTSKVVVFCVYKAVIARLRGDLEKAGLTVGVVDGDVPGRERADVLGRFQDMPDPRVLICHPTTTAYGVELSAADTMIFNGPPPLGGFIYAQALERLSSVKQKASKISIIRIYSTPEEKKYFKTLDNGKEMGNFVGTLFEDFSRGAI